LLLKLANVTYWMKRDETRLGVIKTEIVVEILVRIEKLLGLLEVFVARFDGI